MQKTTKTQLGRIQRMACLTITGAMKTAPTAAMELILNLTQLDLLIMAEARMTLYRLHKFMQPADSTASAGMLSIWKNVSDHVLDMQSGHTIPVYNFSKIYKVKLDVDNWRNNDLNLPEDIIVWFTDGSRMDSGTGAGLYGIRPNRSFSFSLDKFASVFQTEIYAIIQCAYENIRRAYKNKRIMIFSGSQAALKALSGPKVTSRLVVECQDALLALANHNEVTLMGVPGHQGIFGIEEADKLARQGSAAPLLGPEPALGTPRCLARDAIKNWTELQHFTTWTHKPGCKHGKLFIGRPCKKRAKTKQASTQTDSRDPYWTCSGKKSPANY
jgi:ribonuclease HI